MTDSRQQRRVRARGKAPNRTPAPVCHCTPGVTWCRACFQPPGVVYTGREVNKGSLYVSAALAARLAEDAPHV